MRRVGFGTELPTVARRRLIRCSARAARCPDARLGVRERAWPGRRRQRRRAVIRRCEQRAVAARESLVPYLQWRRRAMRVSLSKTFLRTRTRADATRAVEAHMGDARAVRDGLVVRRADDVHVDVVHRRVVVEPSAIPIATRVSNAEVAEA